MLLALDYDDTYTRDPIFWDSVISLATQRGHSVICVTMREDVPHEANEVREALAHQVEEIIFTNRKAKYKHVCDKGYYMSVWVDDNPHFVHMDAQ